MQVPNANLDFNKKSLLYLSVLISTICFIIFYSLFFDNKFYIFADYASDSKDSYFMTYNGVFYNLTSGNLTLWDFNDGFGSNLLSAQTIMNDPLSFIIYPIASIFGISSIPFGITAMIILKVACACFAIYFFLSAFSFSEKSKIIAALCYGFCGYMMFWNQHYFMVTMLTFLPLLFMCIEMSFYNRRFLIGLSVCIAGLLFFSIYFAFSALIAIAIYGILRFFMINKKPYGIMARKQLLPVIIAGIIGVLMMFVIILPAVYQMIINSDRLETRFSVIDNILGILNSDMLSKSTGNMFLQLFTANYSYQSYYVMVYFSPLFVILLPQYFYSIIKKKEFKRNIIIKFTLLAFSVAFITIPLFGLLANGLSSYSNRFTFLLMPMFAIVVASALTDIFTKKGLNKYVFWISFIFISALLSFFLLNSSYWEAKDIALFIKKALVLGMSESLCFGMLLYLYVYKFKKSVLLKLSYFMLCGAVVLSLGIDGKAANDKRAMLTKTDIAALYDKNVSDAFQLQNELSHGLFFRAEKSINNISTYLESFANDYHGISHYNSLLNRYTREFDGKLWDDILIGKASGYATYSYNPLSNNLIESLVGLKYILTQEDNYDTVIYNQISQMGGYTLYENPNAGGLGILFNKAINQKSFESLSKTQQQLLLWNTLLINDPAKQNSLPGYDDLEAKNAIDNRVLLNDAIDYHKFQIRSIDQPQSLNKIGDEFTIPEIGMGSDAFFSVDTAKLREHKNSIYMHFNINALIKEGSKGVKTYPDIMNPDGSLREYPCNYWIRVYFDTGSGIDPTKQMRFLCNALTVKDVVFNIPHNAKQIIIELAAVNEYLIPVNEVIKGAKISNMELFTIDGLSLPNQGATVFDNPKTDNRISGTVQSGNDGYLFLSIPYEEGWTAFVDGKQAKILRADYGFSALELRAGNHQIELLYTTPGMQTGLIATCFGLAAFILFCRFYILRKTNKD